MKYKEIRPLQDDELKKQLATARRELLNLRIQAKIGRLENPARVRQVRRDVARMLTEVTGRARTRQQAAGNA